MPNSRLLSVLKSHQGEYSPVVAFDPQTDKLHRMDLTAGNKNIPANLLDDIDTFTSYINDQLKTSDALYGIGGYAEHRSVYDRSGVFDAQTPGDEPRRLHLGIDIWGMPRTPVIAPLNSTVHSYAFNNDFGDYGATIILSHLLDGISFYTLYGHLSLASIKNMREGDKIKKGDPFAEFGIPAENGQWPPHLHFQVIEDLDGWKGDYPGVCKFSQKETWLANCPDPDLVLQLNQYL